MGERVDEAEFGAHLDDEGAIRFPGGEAMAVGAEEVGEEEGGFVVVTGATGGEAASGSVDDGGRDDEDLVLAGPEEIDDEVMSSFEGDEAVGGRDIELGDAFLEAVEAGRGVGDLEAEERGAGLVQDSDIVGVLAPIDTDQQFH